MFAFKRTTLYIMYNVVVDIVIPYRYLGIYLSSIVNQCGRFSVKLTVYYINIAS